MTAQKVIPSLSADAWVSSGQTILDYILSYYFLTDSQQSYLYKGSLISLPETYYKFIDSPDDLATGINKDLTSLLSAYFSQSEVNSRVVKDANSDSKYYVYISAIVITDTGERIEINKLANLVNSRINKVLTVNNYGDAAAMIAAQLAQ